MNGNQLKDKNILVTGGCGFIGGHIVDYLIELGANVFIYDNLSNGHYFNPKISFLYNADIRNLNLMSKIIKKENIEYIIHQAALVNVPESFTNPKEYHDVNVVGTFNVLECARINNIKKVVLASSCAVQGAISPYAYTKYLNEIYSREYLTVFKVPNICLRYFNVYGERQKTKTEGAVIPIFIKRVLNNDVPIIYGNGNQIRDFIYVKDIVLANIYALCSNEIGAYSVGTSVGTTINELLSLIQELIPTSKKNIPFYKPERVGDILYSKAFATNFLKKWQSTVNLKEGLTNTIEWYKNNG